MPDTGSGSTRTFRTSVPGDGVALAAIALVAIGLIALVVAPSARAVGVVLVVAAAVLWAALRRRKLQLTETDLVVTGVRRVRRYPWAEVSHARAVPAGLAFLQLEVAMRDGRSVAVGGIGSWGRRPTGSRGVDRLADAINARASGDGVPT